MAFMLALALAGCQIFFVAGQTASSDSDRRMRELLNTSFESGPPDATPLRQVEIESPRFWFPDQPSHMTPERVHGGIQ